MAIPNDSDINPSFNILAFDIDSFVFDGTYSLTLTAQGGTTNINEFSRNIIISPKASPTP